MKKSLIVFLTLLSVSAGSLGAVSVCQNTVFKNEPAPTNTYIVSFETNGGNHIDNQKINEGGKIEKPANPTKTDYSFGGWFIDPSFSGDEYDFNTLIDKDITLFAKWVGGPQPIITTYTVDFQGQNCSSSLDLSKKYVSGDKLEFDIVIEDKEKYKLPQTINISGVKNYEYNNTNGKVNFTISDNNVLLVAIAEEIKPGTTYTVSFVLNGATSDSIEPITVSDGGSIPSDKIPDNPTKPGYSFDCWSLSEKSKDEVDLSTATFSNNTILYAFWSSIQSVDITFNANGGYFDNPSTTSKVVTTNYGQIPIAPTPVKVDSTGENSYVFNGWDYPLEPAKSQEEGGRVLYNATWSTTKNKCHVTFDANGGTITNGGDPVDVIFGQTISVAPTVARDGYNPSIVEWYDAREGGNKFTFNESKVTQNMTLYAHWGEIKKYTVEFNANGGIYSETNNEIVTRNDVPYNTVPSVPTNPTKEDSTEGTKYTFIGYDKNIVPVTGDNTQTIKYTAQWANASNKCHVTFDPNGGYFESGGDPIDVDKGAGIYKPVVKRDGYKSSDVQWATDREGNNKFYFGVDTVEGNITLYAIWGQINKYTVKFVANGGIYSENDLDTIIRYNVPYNTMPDIPDNPTKEVSGSGKIYIFTGYDRNVVPVTGDNTQTITYTAQWEEIEVTNKCTITVKTTNEGKFPDDSIEKNIIVLSGSNILNSIAFLEDPIFNDSSKLKVFDKFVYDNGDDIGVDDTANEDNIIIKATYKALTKKSLNECTWDEISYISKQGAVFSKNYFGEIKNSDGTTNSFEKEIIVNHQIQKVRIIGYGEDVDENGNPIGITFEFVNILSDENGYSLAAYWNDVDKDYEHSNNYDDSTIRACLNGTFSETSQGSTQPVNWFQYFGMDEDNTDATKGTTSKNLHFSNNYSNKSVLDMLPTDLSRVIKTTKKYTNIYNKTIEDWEEKHIADKLFLLSPSEIGEDIVELPNQEEKTSCYSYYNVTNLQRIKYQLKKNEGARTDKASALDGNYEGSHSVFAGFNSPYSNEGGHYWLRSPCIDDWTYIKSYSISENGVIGSTGVKGRAIGVAPAFCI